MRISALERGKGLLRTRQISILQGSSDCIEILAPVCSEKRIIPVDRTIPQSDDVVVVLLRSGYIARL